MRYSMFILPADSSSGTACLSYLLTVAGEATAKSCTSNNMWMYGVNLILSELAKHNILLSSNTVFMFSIHRASTGPSQITHWWSVDVSWKITHTVKFANLCPEKLLTLWNLQICVLKNYSHSDICKFVSWKITHAVKFANLCLEILLTLWNLQICVLKNYSHSDICKFVAWLMFFCSIIFSHYGFYINLGFVRQCRLVNMVRQSSFYKMTWLFVMLSVNQGVTFGTTEITQNIKIVLRRNWCRCFIFIFIKQFVTYEYYIPVIVYIIINIYINMHTV